MTQFTAQKPLSTGQRPQFLLLGKTRASRGPASCVLLFLLFSECVCKNVIFLLKRSYSRLGNKQSLVQLSWQLYLPTFPKPSACCLLTRGMSCNGLPGKATITFNSKPEEVKGLGNFWALGISVLAGPSETSGPSSSKGGWQGVEFEETRLRQGS